MLFIIAPGAMDGKMPGRGKPHACPRVRVLRCRPHRTVAEKVKSVDSRDIETGNATIDLDVY
jgi:hypothetical protein